LQTEAAMGPLTVVASGGVLRPVQEPHYRYYFCAERHPDFDSAARPADCVRVVSVEDIEPVS